MPYKDGSFSLAEMVNLTGVASADLEKAAFTDEVDAWLQGEKRPRLRFSAEAKDTILKMVEDGKLEKNASAGSSKKTTANADSWEAYQEQKRQDAAQGKAAGLLPTFYKEVHGVTKRDDYEEAKSGPFVKAARNYILANDLHDKTFSDADKVKYVKAIVKELAGN